MKGLMKRCFASVLSVAMAVTMVPVSGLATAYAAGAQATVESRSEDVQSSKYLTVYSTKKAFYAKTDRVEQETESVYMAVSEDGKTYNVLNNGGGVIFSKSPDGTLRVQNPTVYVDNAKADAPFTVVAQDSDATKGYHVFTSKDGVNYYDDTVVASYETAAPLNKADVKLMLDGENILESDDSITLGNAVTLTDEQYTYIVNKLGTIENTGLETLSDLKLTNAEAKALTEAELSKKYPSVNAVFNDGSTQKFNIDWTDALKGVDLSAGGTFQLKGTVVQPKYLNNLKALNGSDLPDDNPDNVTTPKDADNYDPDTKTVYYDETKFIEGMADPNIYWDEQSGYYYMTASYFPEEGDEIDENDKPDQYDRIVLRRGRTLEELQSRKEQVTIWKVQNQKFEANNGTEKQGYRYIWAPEIHRVGDKWVVYFTESHSSGNAYDIFSHALVLDGDRDPYDTALVLSGDASEWKDYQMRLADGVEDPLKSLATSFCLDMTYFKNEADGQSYVVWAGKPTASYQGTSTDLFIATVNEDKPWEVTSPSTRLTCSEYGWERIRYCVNEGPTVLQHDGKIFLCYSVSGTGSEYAIGMCSADSTADLLDIANWTKSPYPLLTSRDVDGEEGPGHNSFTVDQDGNVIFVYHARPTSHNYQMCGKYSDDPLKDPCRHARLKRVHWAADGTPILKMTYEEELKEEYKTVSLNVQVDIPVSAVTLNKSSLSLEIGKSETLTAAVAPANASDKAVTWKSSNTAVATVANGKVTAVKAGTADITATAGGKSATCKVTVKAAGPTVKKLSLNAKKLTLGVKETYSLKATVNPKSAAKSVKWESNKSAVATVKNGKVTAKKAGTAKITASVGSKSATCTVTVKNAPKKVTLNKKKVSLKPKKTFKIKAKVGAKEACNSFTYTSSKKKVAKVDGSGKVTALKKGTATITVKAYNGKKATLKVTVK